MPYYFFSKGYPAPLIWTLLQRDTTVSPGMLLSSRAPIPMGRESCVSPCPGSKDRALSLLHVACEAGVLGSAFHILMVPTFSAAGSALTPVGEAVLTGAQTELLL